MRKARHVNQMMGNAVKLSTAHHRSEVAGNELGYNRGEEQEGFNFHMLFLFLFKRDFLRKLRIHLCEAVDGLLQ